MHAIDITLIILFIILLSLNPRRYHIPGRMSRKKILEDPSRSVAREQAERSGFSGFTTGYYADGTCIKCTDSAQNVPRT